MPEPTDVHVDSTLSNISIKFTNGQLIADQVLPEVKVNKRSNKYWKYDHEDAWRLDDDALGPKADPNEIEMVRSTDNYSVEDFGLSDHVPQEEIDEADAPLQPLADAAENIADKLKLKREKRCADLVFAAGTYPTGYKVQLSGTSQFNDKSNSTPLDVLLDAVEGTLIRANTLVVGADVWKKARVHPQLLDAVKAATRNQGAQGGMVSPEELITLLEIENLLIGRARYNSAVKGQPASLSRIWGKHVAALYVTPNPGLKKVSFGYTFRESLMTTYRSFDGKKGVKGAHYIKNAWNEDRKIVADVCGYFIEDAVA